MVESVKITNFDELNEIVIQLERLNQNLEKIADRIAWLSGER